MGAIIIRQSISRHANIAYVAQFIPQVYELLQAVSTTTDLPMQARVSDYAARMKTLLAEYPETVRPAFFYEVLGIPLSSDLLQTQEITDLSLDLTLMQSAVHWPSIVKGQVNNFRWLIRGVPVHTCAGVTRNYIAQRYNLKISGQVPV